MWFRSVLFISLEISFWKDCDLSFKLVEGTCRWTIDSIIISSQKEECVKEMMCEAKQQTSPPYCHVNSKRPLYLNAFPQTGLCEIERVRCFWSIWSVVTYFCFPMEMQTSPGSRDLLFSVNLCRHQRCNSLILQDSGITLLYKLTFGGQCHLILHAVWAAKVMDWSCCVCGGHNRYGWYFCGCGELRWCRQTHQKLLCCSGSVVGLSNLIWAKLAWASVWTQLVPSPA